MTKPDQTLKPCPFCGGESALDSCDGMNWHVHCNDCDMNNPHNNSYQTKKEAEKAWNMRVSDEEDVDLLSNSLGCNPIKNLEKLNIRGD